MEEFKTERIKFVEVAKGIYAAITPACGLDITDAGMMDNFSNSAYIARGEGLICDTFFDLPHAQELKDFCIRKSGHASEYVINTHGHWDHFWATRCLMALRSSVTKTWSRTAQMTRRRWVFSASCTAPMRCRIC